MRNRIAVTVVAAIALVGCSSSPTPEATNASVDLAVTTTIVETTTVAPEVTTTLPVETTIPPAPTTVAPVTQSSSASSSSKTTTTTPKSPTATQVPQLQLTGTPQDQANQVVAATAKVAAISGDFKTWTTKLSALNASLVSYGVKVTWDPNRTGRDIYQISMGGQSVCFIWTYASPTSNEKHFEAHSCS
jgi:hypothetical protein